MTYPEPVYAEKIVDGVTFSTYHGNKFDLIGVTDLIKHIIDHKKTENSSDDIINRLRNNLYNLFNGDPFNGDPVPAVVQVISTNGDVIQLAGFRGEKDIENGDLHIVAMKSPDGKITTLGKNKRFTVEFDKETVADPDPKKNQIKGAVTTDSAIDIIEKLTGEGLLKKKLERETPEYMIVPKERKKYPVRTQYASDVTPPTVGSLPRGNKTLLS